MNRNDMVPRSIGTFHGLYAGPAFLMGLALGVLTSGLGTLMLCMLIWGPR